MRINEASPATLARLGQALADPARVRILGACRGRELCVCQLLELTGLAPATVSAHVGVLRDAGLLDTRKQGRWVYCRAADSAAAGPLAAFHAAALDAAARSVEREALAPLLAVEPSELTRVQRASGVGAWLAERRCC
jgi:ArsR family transcriptional regulator